jgi:pimeloyl-ACP methyl ester carboxylesterase
MTEETMLSAKTHALGAFASLAILSACSSAPSTGADERTGVVTSALSSNDVVFTAAVRGTGTATIHLHIYANHKAPHGVNILAVPGLSENGFIYAPLADAIFGDPLLGHLVHRVIALDPIGHGDSSFPSNLPDGLRFGDLLIEDDVAVVLQAVPALARDRLAPRVILGHSMGGLEIQAAQQFLLTHGSSFADLGVFAAVLLAPVPAHGLPWVRPPSGDATPFLVTTPTLGTYLSLPPEAFIPLAFTTTSGQVAANAPTPAQVAAGRYVGPEPLNTLLELTEAAIPLPDGGTITLQRPSVSAGILAPERGTLTTVVSFSEDTLVPAPNLQPLYEYLTGDKKDLLYRPVVAADAVHAMVISNPDGMLDAISPAF